MVELGIEKPVLRSREATDAQAVKGPLPLSCSRNSYFSATPDFSKCSHAGIRPTMFLWYNLGHCRTLDSTLILRECSHWPCVRGLRLQITRASGTTNQRHLKT